MTAVEAVSPAPREEWERLLAADPDALVTQGPAWTDVVCSRAGLDDASRLYRFADGSRLVLPLVASRLTGRRASFPHAWGFGGLVGPARDDGRPAAVVADLARHVGLSLRLRPNPLQRDAWLAAMPEAATRISRRAHVLDLAGGWDAVWSSRFTSGTRRNVRLAEKAGLRVEVDAEGRLLDDFFALYRLSVDRWARMQHEPRALAHLRAARRDPPAKWRRALLGLHGAGRLWMAYADGRPVAGIVVLQGHNAQYVRGAMDIELARPTRANHLLHRLAIEEACRAGSRSYQMGETGGSASLAQFKESFGARPVGYFEYLLERLPLSAADRHARAVVKRVLRFRDSDA